MNKSRLFLMLMFVIVIFFMATNITTAGQKAGQKKVEVCHMTGAYKLINSVEVPVGHVISVAEPAYQSHIAHGDPEDEQWVLVKLPSGSEVCIPDSYNPESEPEPEPEPQGDDSCFQASAGKMIFITSEKVPIDMNASENIIGNLDNPIDRADAICNYYAHEASLCGTYKAWLAVDNAPALERSTTSFPIVRPDNVVVAENEDDLLGLQDYLADPICINEWGLATNDVQETPRIVWKVTAGNENLGFGMTSCCDKDEYCSRVGYTIAAMGLHAYLFDPEVFFDFTLCAEPVSNISDTLVRIYCIQQ